jgi:sulfopyruvate decarboxylase alpha subunit
MEREDRSAELNGVEFCAASRQLGYDFFTGVPDSTLASIFKVLETDPQYTYISSVREDNAIGLAVGAYLGGLNPLVLMQNSGLGHCITALLSLSSLYRIPLLLVLGWRGFDQDDAPEHLMMGRILPSLLRTVEVEYLAPSATDVAEAMARLSHTSKAKRVTTALLLREDIVS